MRLYLIRHPRVAVADGICYGRTDVDLHEDWPGSVARIEAKLPTEAVTEENFYTSPLRRCHAPASRLAPRVRTSEHLREMDFGEWEGRPWSSIPRDEIDAWRANLTEFRAPGGESLGDVSRRSLAFLSEIERREHDHAFVVTHGGVVRCLVAHALGLPLDNAVRVHVDFEGVSILRIDGDVIRIEGLNL